MKKFYVGVKGFVVKDGKMLLLKKRGEGFWEVPGGRIDDDESIEQALRRELKEEVSNIGDANIGEIVGAHRLQKNVDSDISLVLVYFLVHATISGDPELSEEHEDFMWADKHEALQRMIDKKDIIETVFEKL